MTARELINFLGIIEKLKTTPRHNVMRSGRVESVAEHSWRLAVMAMLAAGEEQGLDRDRLIKLALVHDFGEAGYPGLYQDGREPQNGAGGDSRALRRPSGQGMRGAQKPLFRA